jgi:hypothetical protein
VLAALLYAGLAWSRWRLPAGQLTTGTLASSYVNAGTLGLPVSVYVLGDASYVAPVLLFQVLVMAPVGLAVSWPAPGRPPRPRRTGGRCWSNRSGRRSSSAAPWACCWRPAATSCRPSFANRSGSSRRWRCRPHWSPTA